MAIGNDNGVTRWIMLNKVPTKILVYDSGQCSNSGDDQNVCTNQDSFNCDRLVLMISGNPGEIEYYRSYLSTIHKQTKLPTIGLSNSGHNRIPDSLPKDDNPSLYTLDMQVHHKYVFIKDHISPETRLIILAHSIGCYVTIDLLKRYPDVNKMIDHCVLVFPTIDSLGSLSYAKSLQRLFTTFYYPLLALSYCMDYLLPDSVKQSIVRYAMKSSQVTNTELKVPDFVIESSTNLFSPFCLKTIRVMCLDEFSKIEDPDIETINQNKSKLTFLYGENDHWCPVSYYERIKSHCDGDIRLCLGQIEHAFVCDPIATEKIAFMTTDIINEKV